MGRGRTAPLAACPLEARRIGWTASSGRLASVAAVQVAYCSNFSTRCRYCWWALHRILVGCPDPPVTLQLRQLSRCEQAKRGPLAAPLIRLLRSHHEASRAAPADHSCHRLRPAANPSSSSAWHARNTEGLSSRNPRLLLATSDPHRARRQLPPKVESTCS